MGHRTFRTTADRSGRVSAELSMGSIGAMSHAAPNPHMFSAAVAFGSAVERVDRDRLEG